MEDKLFSELESSLKEAVKMIKGRSTVKVSFKELPNVPDISRSFVRFEKHDELDELDRLMLRTVENIKKGKLKMWGKEEYVDCRVNPETFGIEALIDGKWRAIEVLAADHYLGN